MKEVLLLGIGIGIGAYIMKLRLKGKEEFEQAVQEEVARRNKPHQAQPV